MRIAVVSAVFGGYDRPVFVEQTVGCRYVMVTDGLVDVPAGWEHQVVDRGRLDPRLAGKFVKCRPWEFADADVFVWLDGSIEPAPGLVAQMIDDLGGADVAFHPHPHRSSIKVEAQVSAAMAKYDGQPVVEQAATYVAAGHPDSWGLYAAGLFVWRDSPFVRQMGQRWLDEICRWSVQDQLSLPVVLAESELWVNSLSGGLMSNPLFRIRAHADRT